ncbi:hypothetical protein XENOCAPTIV_029547 [Xenoophorus captivus]|uniref:Uncharacterized protein n=1 Tax=Xenoophorus captivus TaxID=1517983 RepID=A0ABV0SES4_9TELE
MTGNEESNALQSDSCWMHGLKEPSDYCHCFVLVPQPELRGDDISVLYLSESLYALLFITPCCDVFPSFKCWVCFFQCTMHASPFSASFFNKCSCAGKCLVSALMEIFERKFRQCNCWLVPPALGSLNRLM